MSTHHIVPFAGAHVLRPQAIFLRYSHTQSPVTYFFVCVFLYYQSYFREHYFCLYAICQTELLSLTQYSCIFTSSRVSYLLVSALALHLHALPIYAIAQYPLMPPHGKSRVFALVTKYPLLTKHTTTCPQAEPSVHVSIC